MENDRPLTRCAHYVRDGYLKWVRFMSAVHGGEPAAKAAEIAALERLYRAPSDAAEKAP